jgi:hypothetical protein
MTSSKLPLGRDNLEGMGWITPSRARDQRKAVRELLALLEAIGPALPPSRRAELDGWIRCVRVVVLGESSD